MSDVKLYAWQPKGHGAFSFFVAARSEKEAFEAVNKKIESDAELQGYFSDGWGTDYYRLRVCPVGAVIFNDND